MYTWSPDSFATAIPLSRPLVRDWCVSGPVWRHELSQHFQTVGCDPLGGHNIDLMCSHQHLKDETEPSKIASPWEGGPRCQEPTLPFPTGREQVHRVWAQAPGCVQIPHGPLGCQSLSRALWLPTAHTSGYQDILVGATVESWS